jgi:hypothetical protein
MLKAVHQEHARTFDLAEHFASLMVKTALRGGVCWTQATDDEEPAPRSPLSVAARCLLLTFVRVSVTLGRSASAYKALARLLHAQPSEAGVVAAVGELFGRVLRFKVRHLLSPHEPHTSKVGWPLHIEIPPLSARTRPQPHASAAFCTRRRTQHERSRLQACLIQRKQP